MLAKRIFRRSNELEAALTALREQHDIVTRELAGLRGARDDLETHAAALTQDLKARDLEIGQLRELHDAKDAELRDAKMAETRAYENAEARAARDAASFAAISKEAEARAAQDAASLAAISKEAELRAARDAESLAALSKEAELRAARDADLLAAARAELRDAKDAEERAYREAEARAARDAELRASTERELRDAKHAESEAYRKAEAAAVTEKAALVREAELQGACEQLRKDAAVLRTLLDEKTKECIALASSADEARRRAYLLTIDHQRSVRLADDLKSRLQKAMHADGAESQPDAALPGRNRSAAS